MSPVIRQPEDNPYLRLPNPPNPPRTEEVICDLGADCCGSACFDSMVGCGLGSVAGICLEYATTGTLASSHFVFGLCCAFGFTCCCQNLGAQVIKKRRQLDYAYHQNLLNYNTRLHERVIMLSRQRAEFDSNQCQCHVSQSLNNLMPRVVDDPCVGGSEQHSACESPVKSKLCNKSLALAFLHNRFRSLKAPHGASGMSDV